MAPKKASSASSAPPTTGPVASKVVASKVVASKAVTSKADSVDSLSDAFKTVWDGYWTTTNHQTLLLDTFLAFLVAIGGIQALYFLVCGRNPFNAFLAGFIATVGQFILTVALRIQTQEQNKEQFTKISPERAFTDYVFGSLILQLFCVNYLN